MIPAYSLSVLGYAALGFEPRTGTVVMTHPLPAHHSCPPGHRPTHPHTWTPGLVDTSWYVLKELREGWKSSEAKGFITVKTLFFLPSKGWGEEGVERENKSFLCRGRLKDRAIIAALRHSGSSLGNARGLVGSYMSHISCIYRFHFSLLF